MGYAQNLNDLPREERNKILIQKSKEAVMKYGPDWYREVKPPVIEVRILNERGSDPIISIEDKGGALTWRYGQYEADKDSIRYIIPKAEAAKMKGRIQYSVGFPYDENYEHMPYGLARTFLYGTIQGK